MSMIYEPKGKAREYSPYALNLYLSCTHKCKYCYAPKCRYQTEEQYFVSPFPRKDIIEQLEGELKKESPKQQILLSFIGDVYCDTQDDNKTTREALELLLKYKAPVAILTKNKKCLKDLDLFKAFGEHIQVGMTLTFDNDKDSLEWESGASTPQERLDTLMTLHENGVRTFASFEPVIIPSQSLNLMGRGLGFIDTYKVGKLNNYRGLDKEIDWTDFLERTVKLLRDNNKAFYIKHDLRINAPSVRLFGNEVLYDEHNVY